MNDLQIEINPKTLDELTEELRIVNALLDERNKLLDAIPPCPYHGSQCVPHALNWIETAKEVQEAAYKWLEATTDGD